MDRRFPIPVGDDRRAGVSLAAKQALTPFGKSPNNISLPCCVYTVQAIATCIQREDLVQVVLVKVKELRTRGSFSF
jgi:hypothetical protein